MKRNMVRRFFLAYLIVLGINITLLLIPIPGELSRLAQYKGSREVVMEKFYVHLASTSILITLFFLAVAGSYVVIQRIRKKSTIR